MIRRRLLIIAIVLSIVLATGRVGLVTSVNAAPSNVLALYTNTNDTQILDAVSEISYVEVSPAAFLTIDLSDYDILYVGSTFQDGWVTIPSPSHLGM